MSGADPLPAPVLPLRDRQRVAIRAELRRAAYRLFIEHGYNNVTIHDIAAAAGLSKRTVFRHVATKEDLLLGPPRHGGAAIARLLEEQPQTQAPDTALKNAIVARAAAFEDGESQDWRAAVLSAPELLNKLTMVTTEDRERIVKIIAARMHTDSEDPRPGLLAHLAFAAGDYGFQRWIRQPDTHPRTLRDWVEDCLNSIISRRWRDRSGTHGG
ncbi:TetR/AcrR family transcriptional regulator [Mycobacterium intracellulare]|uniref:TetR/AcrR family transcriptional regulator n=1 Tax=Mycobacterium intracellulare TaxID=1767 RepID=UPI00025296F0|nr:TetR/AcrR family transcriptional regulator [Mycobacterium intracellulare]AFC47446.1 transcriptional regulator, TetR family protein [Mycobacterium intracellulare MOTT-02]ASW94266.1 TetR family transcriptional regulator [Mycobacterium intracellulare]MCA2235506.1 TetR family transcriptional regulator [Mycobacterium intracellulare]MCA2256632.1 TetR family transcriptional regulator [Mycobacterium intracellulare]MCA2356828.1 TetR family transcriptional regulator [Mycobacterium intracellulare]